MNYTNPMPGGITGLPFYWRKYVQESGPPRWESLKFESVKYGHESCRAWTRETALAKHNSNCYRPILSSEVASNISNPITITVIRRTVPRNNYSRCFMFYSFAAICFGPCWPSSSAIHNYFRKLLHPQRIRCLCY
jgi:hypothetical protein